MQFSGNLIKMSVAFDPQKDSVVNYSLNLNDSKINVNELIGKELNIEFQGVINCIKCGRKTNKSFNQGFCYPCFQTAPEADPAIIKPELDQSHLGISRDMEWAKKNSLIDHYVYIALSTGIKVGVTKAMNIPSRWIDQGAWKGILLAKTPYRQLAGEIEVALKAHFADKTNWRRMLTNNLDFEADVLAEKEKAQNLIPEELKQYIIEDNSITEIIYPIENYPKKVKSLSLDKTAEVKGVLTGIKGQYLIFDEEFVFNVRKHNGYLVKLNY